MAEKDCRDIERRVLAYGEVGGDKVGPVDVELGEEVKYMRS